MAIKFLLVEGHAFVGWFRRPPPYGDVVDAVCQCKAAFSAKTKKAMRAMQRAHAEQVKAAREVRGDFETVIAWASRDQSEALQIVDIKGKLEVMENFKTIQRVEKAVDALLEREAR